MGWASKVQVGKISYYGVAFHGRLTASGEKYNMYALTAAHRTLPFGTLVRVTNLTNNKSVVVRINDRGPLWSGYIIDISQAAAEKIGLILAGTVMGKVEVLKMPLEGRGGASLKKAYFVVPGRTSLKNLPNPLFDKKGTYTIKGQRVHHIGKYGIQVGAYANLDNAKEMYEVVRQKGFQKVFIQVVRPEKDSLPTYRLVVGVYESEDMAKRYLVELQKRQLTGIPVMYY
ncbi:MAG: septal ring lytic transglycosylase RlpA family protein [Bacteroidia bacterium]|nr:septal ring lytic transglycosylase RlpA family protein [Bacteroidia bacterium]